MRLRIGTLMLLLLAGQRSVHGQVLNGDFSSGLDHWTVLRVPGGFTFGFVDTFDIDGAGPLGASTAYSASVGLGDQRRLQQSVLLTAGTTYHFSANVATLQPGETGTSDNLDGGTISFSVGNTLINSFAFGHTLSGIPEYGVLTGTYLAQSTGPQILNIDINRAYLGAIGITPENYIDNIQFSPIPEPAVMPFLSAAILAIGVGISKRDIRCGMKAKLSGEET